MGYTHYYYVPKKFDAKKFAAVAEDFKKMIEPLRHLGVVLADGLGKNYPTISPTSICFNGLERCGHTEQDLGITWPGKSASGIAKRDVTGQKFEDIVSGQWFAGAKLSTRTCGGNCSHETFSLEQKLETKETCNDGSTYEKEPDKDHKAKYFAFTKTAFKPYDLAVNVCLIIAKHHFGEKIIVHSDGTMENWEEGMQLCQHFLNYGDDFKLDEDN